MAADCVIVDNGGANIASLQHALQRLGATAELSGDAKRIEAATRVILPGVGSAREGMSRLKTAGLVETIRSLSQPVLGVCLGMQLLAEHSEEDSVTCLGVIPGAVRKLPASRDYPVPNMGWSAVAQLAPHPLLSGIDDDEYFYFLHSYALLPGDGTVAVSSHSKAFAAVIAHENFMAAQFHPERSSLAGAKLLSNFMQLSA